LLRARQVSRVIVWEAPQRDSPFSACWPGWGVATNANVHDPQPNRGPACSQLVLKNPAWEAYFDIGADYLQKDFQNIHDKNMENAVSKVSPEELQILKETQQWPDDCISNWLQFCNWNVREEDKALGNRFHWTVFRLYNPLEKPNPLSLDQVKKCYTLNIKPELASMLKHLSLNHTRGYLQGEFLSKYQNVALMETIIAHQWNQLTNLHDLEQRMVPNNLQADN